jgi:hypothetical protein
LVVKGILPVIKELQWQIVLPGELEIVKPKLDLFEEDVRIRVLELGDLLRVNFEDIALAHQLELMPVLEILVLFLCPLNLAELDHRPS